MATDGGSAVAADGGSAVTTNGGSGKLLNCMNPPSMETWPPTSRAV